MEPWILELPHPQGFPSKIWIVPAAGLSETSSPSSTTISSSWRHCLAKNPRLSIWNCERLFDWCGSSPGFLQFPSVPLSSSCQQEIRPLKSASTHELSPWLRAPYVYLSLVARRLWYLECCPAPCHNFLVCINATASFAPSRAFLTQSLSLPYHTITQTLSESALRAPNPGPSCHRIQTKTRRLRSDENEPPPSP